MYTEVVEARSDYKKYHLWWFRNVACVDSTGSNWIEKELVCVAPRLALGKGERVVWFIVCGGSLDGWANGGSVDVFSMHGEYDFSSIGSWC